MPSVSLIQSMKMRDTMKSHRLYVPVLLLTLSTACGTTRQTKTDRDKAVEKIQANHTVATNIQANIANARPEVVADEVTPPVPPVVAPPGSPAPSSAPATPAPAPIAAEPPLANVPAVETPASPPATSGEGDGHGAITTGVPAIDSICKKSFVGLEALVKGDQAAFDAINLTPAANQACFQVLSSTTGNIFSQLEMLGLPFTFTLAGQRVTFGTKNWPKYAANPGLVPVIINVAGGYAVSEKNDNLADASERLEYITLSIAEIEAKDPSALTSVDKNNLRILKSSLTVQQEMIGTINQRVDYLNIAINFMDLGLNVATISQILAQPPRPPAGEPAPAAQPTAPPAAGAGSTGPVTNETPTVPVPASPMPEPVPAPVPLPDPTPVPAPTPTP